VIVLVRFAYLAVSNAFAALRLLPMSDRRKDIEILALRHQITVLERQLGAGRVRFNPADRALLAALLCSLPRSAVRRIRLAVSPDTILRWHRDLIRSHHSARSRPSRPGRPRTVASIRRLVLRLATENGSVADLVVGRSCQISLVFSMIAAMSVSMWSVGSPALRRARMRSAAMIRPSESSSRSSAVISARSPK
jgi:hypothetical protein